MADLGFTHLFYPGDAGQPVILLLHGTGGDEHDLLDLGRAVAAGAGILSLRGKVMENGMPRFFKRLGEGVFDMDDLVFRTDELADFIAKARDHYGLKQTPIYALGYSNGANIAAKLLLHHPGVLAGAMLLRVMIPYTVERIPDLIGTEILILAGLMDQIIPVEQPERLANIFNQAGAQVEYHMKPAAHPLVQSDINDMKSWWEKR
jgi:phospholipase/carboxylesterase